MTTLDILNEFTNSTFYFDHQGYLNNIATRFSSETKDCTDYTKFKATVNKYYTSWVELRSIAKVNKVYLSKKLWKAFYAKYVVPIRKERFPEVQNMIDQRRTKHDKNSK